MMVFAIRIEYALYVAVQRSHDANPRKHRRPAIFRREDQHLDRDLPALGLVVGLRKLGNVIASVLKGDEPLPVRQWNRLLERSFPASWLMRRYRRPPA